MSSCNLVKLLLALNKSLYRWTILWRVELLSRMKAIIEWVHVIDCNCQSVEDDSCTKAFLASFDDLLLPLSMLLYCLNTYCPKVGCSCVSAFKWAMRIVKSNLSVIRFSWSKLFITSNSVGFVISHLFRNFLSSEWWKSCRLKLEDS